MIPNDAKILHVGAQGDEMFVWAEVDTERSVMGFEFEVFGTGHEMYEDMGVERSHIGSLMMHDGALVFPVMLGDRWNVYRCYCWYVRRSIPLAAYRLFYCRYIRYGLVY